jgi:hypothetical protein
MSRDVGLPADNIVADCVIVSILLYTGIMPQFNYDITVVGLYSFQGLCVSLAISKMVLHMKSPVANTVL